MQKAPSKVKSASKSATARSRKTGRTTFDKSGRGLWEWQTATGVFEQHITDEQLADLEDSKLTFVRIGDHYSLAAVAAPSFGVRFKKTWTEVRDLDSAKNLSEVRIVKLAKD